MAFKFSDYRKPIEEKFPTIRANGSTTSNWPLKLTYRASNKEVVANARAMQLNMIIETLCEIIKNHPTVDESGRLDSELVKLTECFVDLQHQYQRLQERFFTGDGRSYKKNRGKKKSKEGSVNHLLK